VDQGAKLSEVPGYDEPQRAPERGSSKGSAGQGSVWTNLYALPIKDICLNGDEGVVRNQLVVRYRSVLTVKRREDHPVQQDRRRGRDRRPAADRKLVVECCEGGRIGRVAPG
jgi:hypothetical protein